MKQGILLVLVFCIHNAFAVSARDDFRDKLNYMHTMSAKFNQVIFAKKKAISKSSGIMALSRPGRFRWQTTAPMPQLVVADSKKLWVYDRDLEQVTVKKQEKSVGGTAGIFLSGYNDEVAQDFEITAKKIEKRDCFFLQAKSTSANFQKVILCFSGKSLEGIELFDQLGQHTKVRLSKVKLNPNLPTSLFQFKPPKGVDVVKQ